MITVYPTIRPYTHYQQAANTDNWNLIRPQAGESVWLEHAFALTLETRHSVITVSDTRLPFVVVATITAGGDQFTIWAAAASAAYPIFPTNGAQDAIWNLTLTTNVRYIGLQLSASSGAALFPLLLKYQLRPA